MKKCDICPRKCNVNRELNVGFCNSSNNIKVAKVMKHYWEEPIISGKNGSGAIFFSNCNLKCIFCQNYKISSGEVGKEISINELAKIFKDIEKSGVNNINLVSPTHYTEQIISALKIYKPSIPIIWNSNGYEKPETIGLLKNYIDIFLVDLKFYDSNLSYEICNARNYFEYATMSILEMRKNQPKDIIVNNIMKKGIIIRHLVLPNCTSDSIKIIDWIKNNLGTKTIVSLMNQYTPYYKALSHPFLNKKLKSLEYKRVLTYYINSGFEQGFSQSNESADECYIPNFDCDLNI